MSTPEHYKPKRKNGGCKSCANYPAYTGGIHLYTCEKQVDMRLVENTYVNCHHYEYVPGSDEGEG